MADDPSIHPKSGHIGDDPIGTFHQRLRAGLPELEDLLRLGRRMATSEGFSQAMNSYLDDLRIALQVQAVVLRLPDPTSHEFVLLASSMAPGVALSFAPSRPFTQGIMSKAFTDRRPTVSNHYATDPLAAPYLRDQGVGSVLVVPVIAGDTFIAMLGLMALKPGHFTPRRMQQASVCAERLQSLLHSGQMAQALSGEVERGRKHLDAFREAASKLVLEEQADTTLQHLLDTATLLADARYGALVIWGPNGTVHQFFTSGLSPQERQRMGPFPQGHGLLGLVRGDRPTLRLADISQHPQSVGFPPNHPPMKSFMGVTIPQKAGLGGSFYLTEKRGAPEFTPEDERLLNLFAVTAMVVLHNVGLYTTVVQHRQLLTAVQQSMVDGLTLVGPDGRVAYCNPHAVTLLGLEPEKAVGRPLAELLRERAKDMEDPGVVEKLLSLLGALAGPVTVEMCIMRPLRQDLVVTAFPVHDQGMLGLVTRDVTAERELDRRKDAFVSIASHELRTPMTSIVGFTDLLLKREVAPERSRAWLQEIHTEAQRLASIVDDMLNLSRIHSGKLEVRWEPVAVAQMAGAVVAAAALAAPQHQFVVAIAEDVPEVWADYDKLEQVLTNLVSNAVKYSPKGGKVTVTARHEPERRRVVVGVADEGIGIAPEDQKGLFVSFHRIRRPETEGIRGTGLGLYIVKSLVDMMQGTLWVESELGRGSTFYFTLLTQNNDIRDARSSNFPA